MIREDTTMFSHTVFIEVKNLPVMAIIIGLLACIFVIGVPEHALAAQSGNALTAGSQNMSVQAKQSKPLPSYSLDKFIGLPKTTYVLGKAKSTVKVYKAAKTSSKVLGSFTKNNCIVINTSKMSKGKKYQWLPVYLKNKKQTAYIAANTVTLMTLDTKTFGMNLSIGKNKARLKACKYGLPYMGTRWTGNGTSLTKGINCNQYAAKCLRNAGVKVKKASLAGLAGMGAKIKREQLQPGDLVFYDTSSKNKRPRHVAVYIGNGLVINSSGAQGTTYPTGGIRISHLDYRTPHPFLFKNVIGQ